MPVRYGALAEKGLSFKLVTEVLGTATVTKVNPLEKLPVLILEDGSSVYESNYILQYLELKYPETPMLPPDADGILAARRLEVLCDGVCDAVVLTFFERKRPTEQQSKEWMARQRRKIDGGVREMARLIADRTLLWETSSRPATFAVGTALGYLSLRAFAEFDWRSQYPNLAAYSANLQRLPVRYLCHSRFLTRSCESGSPSCGKPQGAQGAR
jgi:glutathione S-transferase